MSLIFVDVEAWGGCPATGGMTEFGAVERDSLKTFYGVVADSKPDPNHPVCSIPVSPASHEMLVKVMTDFDAWIHTFKTPHKFVSDNPAYDFQWINDAFFRALGRNPFGHSARRIGDFYSGLKKDFFCKQDWKKLRITPHTHHPVDDAMGNVEAFNRLLHGEL